MNVSWQYTDSIGQVKWDGSHAVVMTGMGKRANNTWAKFKDDKRQWETNSNELRQGSTDLIPDSEGKLAAPGLNGRIQEKGTGKWYDGKAYVTSAVSESFDPTVHAPSASLLRLHRRAVPGGRNHHRESSRASEQ